MAQGDDKPSKYFPNVVPPPPNSASLGLYGQVPLNQFTGNATISIPLLEIKSNNLAMPVSLSYSSDGVKVDQYESNVGMGWVLNAGGVITRQVFDYQDNYNGRMQKPNTAPDSNEMITFLDQASTAPQVDTQPDIFCYNVNGMSGKFFLDDTNTPVEIEPSGLKIEITVDFLSMGFAPNSLPEITITDTKGIKYYFGGLNAIESSSSRRIFIENPGPISDDVKTSWYLTKIEDPSTNNQITLNYDSRLITYMTGNEQSLEYTYSGGAKLSSALYNYQYKSYAAESILKEINSNNCKVVFGNSKRFTDPDFPLFKVDDISFFNIQGALIKKIKFDYIEYSGNTFPNTYNQFPEYFKKRFYLRQINEFSTNSSPITHQFEYYSPENLPARFSFAKDNYGVFNGKINSSLISDEIVIPNSIVKASFSDGKLANRSPDKNFGYFGLLKKIIYPTKGTTTLEYEPHVRGKVNIPIYPVQSQFDLSVLTNDTDLFNNTNTASIHSSIEQTIKINGSVINNCSGTNPFSLLLILEITDVSTGLLVNFYNNSSNLDTPILIGSSYTLTGNTSSTNDVFTLQANKDYSIKIKLLRPCMLGNVYFNYYSNPVTFQEKDKEIGGFRIAKIIKNSTINSNLEIEKYYYSPYDCLTCQSGYYINQAPIASIRKIERENLCETPSSRMLYSVGSSNLARMYSSQNAQFGYEYVTKSYGNNFENGAEESKYEIIQDGLPVTRQGEFDITTPFTNSFGSGRLLSHKIFNSIFKRIKETVNQYEHNIAKDKSVTGYNAYKSSQNYSYLGASGPNPPTCTAFVSWDQYTLSEYSLRSQWNYLKQSVETQYDLNGLSPISTTTNYNYNNAAHLQLTSQVTTNSKNETVETRYLYPADFSAEPFMQNLIVANRITPPVSTEQYKGGAMLSKDKTVYANDAFTNNLLLPKNIFAAKFPNNNLNITVPPVGQLEKKITYDQYDGKGNLLQYTLDSGTSVVLIWGYNQTQPIAKIENATYSLVTSYVTNLQTLSNTGTEAGLLTALDNLRNASELSSALVTTYTYKPLIGVSTVTDSKGYRTSYEYDEFNRLKVVKDAQGNILSENQYHYKN
ncbi:RHS repeat domain-containing protein [Flavobacterium sp. ZT3R17]|uniref:RHS repeat domain-containing protein n=1 Tax=Flavobacterium cryoconiti TaxID=3398736 RepID=UPI003A87F324